MELKLQDAQQGIEVAVHIEQWVALSTTENKYLELLMSPEEWTHMQEAPIFLKPLSD